MTPDTFDQYAEICDLKAANSADGNDALCFTIIASLLREAALDKRKAGLAELTKESESLGLYDMETGEPVSANASVTVPLHELHSVYGRVEALEELLLKIRKHIRHGLLNDEIDALLSTDRN